MAVNLLQSAKLLLRVEAVVSHGPSNGQIIFLFNKTIIIFSVRTPPGKGNMMVIAPTPQLVIDELTPIIAVDAFYKLFGISICATVASGSLG
ncbi:MAG: hypothetical protein ABIJ00_13290 [Candidatus Eisenbacteria bacterium]